MMRCRLSFFAHLISVLVGHVPFPRHTTHTCKIDTVHVPATTIYPGLAHPLPPPQAWEALVDVAAALLHPGSLAGADASAAAAAAAPQVRQKKG